MTGMIESDRLLQQSICDLQRFTKEAFEQGLLVKSKGLLSVRTADEKILIAPPDINPLIAPLQGILLYDMNGNCLTSSERADHHGEIQFVVHTLKVRKDVNALGHFHPKFATAFSIHDRSIPFVGEHAETVLKEILWVRCKTCPHRYEGLCQCLEGQRKSYAGVNNLLLENDGIITMGRNIQVVIEQALLMEENAKAAFQLMHGAKGNKNKILQMV